MTSHFSERVYTPPLDDDPYRIRAGGDGKTRMLVIAVAAVALTAFAAVAWNTYGGGPAPLITVEGDYKTAAPAPPAAPGETNEVYRVMEGASVTEISAPGRPPAPAPLDLHPPAGGGGSAPAVELPPAQPAVAAPAPVAIQVQAAGGFMAQLAALRSEQSAREAWTGLDTRHPGLLRGARMDIQRADLGPQGVFYRLRAGYFGDRGQASAFCDRVKGAGAACMVVAR